jgi:hypothetical protein
MKRVEANLAGAPYQDFTFFKTYFIVASFTVFFLPTLRNFVRLYSEEGRAGRPISPCLSDQEPGVVGN